jgi:hypothetical protein
MSRDTAAQEARAGTDILDDVHKRLVRVHAALAERTNSELPEIMPWTLSELMALIREVRAYQQQSDRAPR